MINLEQIKTKIEHHNNGLMDNYRKYAVNVLLRDAQNPTVILQKRSSTINTQPNEISLAGGSLELGETPKEAMLRETEEEFLISRNDIEYIGELDTMITSFNMILFPFVTFYKGGPITTFNQDEVAEVIEVPLSFLMENPPNEFLTSTQVHFPENFPFEKIEKGYRYDFRTGRYPIFFYEYNQTTIWGMTAKILFYFVQALK